VTATLDRDAVVTKPRLRRVDAGTLLTVYLVLLMAIPAVLAFSPLGAAGGPATVYAAILFVYYLVSSFRNTLAPGGRSQQVRLAMIFFACTILASYVSANGHTLPTLEKNGADRELIFLAGWLAVLLIAADGLDNMDRLRTLLRRVVFGATAMATLGLTQFFIGLNAAQYIKITGLTPLEPFSDLLSRGEFNRPAATATHPIEFGAVLAICLPLAIHQARFASPGLRFRRWAQVALIGMTLPMTVSRSAILGFVVCMIVLLPTWPKRDRRVAYVAIFVALVATWATVHGLSGTIYSLFSNFSSDNSTASRTGAFSAAGVYIAQHPWFGHGAGTFLPQTYFFTDDQYLNTIIETGIIGFLALLCLFATGWCTARGVRRMTPVPEDRDLAQCLAACIAIAAVAFVTFDALSFPVATGLTFLLIGCSGALRRLVRERDPVLGPGLSGGSAADRVIGTGIG
jgi:O-antigen ligase